MSHFSLKSLAFYGIAIGSVVILFSLTTAYGEANLKPPTKIEGRYRLKAQDLSGCLKTDELILTIQQSGVYLQGSLSEPDVQQGTSPAKIKPSLNGFWRSQQLELSGLPINLKACQPEVTQGYPVQIQGTIEQTTLKGTIGLGNGSPAVGFMAERAPKPAEPSAH